MTTELQTKIKEALALADKATPGPWELDHSWDEDLAANHVYINSPGHAAFAQVVWRMEDDQRTECCEDNARFIAAAPELADLLRQASAEIERLEKQKKALRNRLVQEICAHTDGVDYEHRRALAEGAVNEFEDAFDKAMGYDQQN